MIVVIDYEAGNLHNVGRALRFLGKEFRFSGNPGEVASASRIILPGVGSARTAMESLEREGLVEVLRSIRVPLLGICLGMQLLFDRSEEEGIPCLGILNGTVRKFDETLAKVPHIGWNQVEITEEGRSGPLFTGIPSDSFFYFVHSYYAPRLEAGTLGVTEYSLPFSSAVCKENFTGVQYHPELSGELGLKLLENFVSDRKA